MSNVGMTTLVQSCVSKFFLDKAMEILAVVFWPGKGFHYLCNMGKQWTSVRSLKL
jgi:hypothetical protein